jgi:hypothetical protein
MKMKKNRFFVSNLFSLLLCLIVGCSSNKSEEFSLKKGDLLFQDLDCGPLCDAIEAVTQGHKEANLSHMGLVIEYPDSGFYILEAVGEGVVETKLNDFLNRSFDAEGNPKVFVSRLKKEYQFLVPNVIKLRNNFLGLPYNSEYILNDSSYYCSQLIHTLFKEANNGKDFFTLYPMTFKQPGSNSFFDSWESYYKELDCDIPEGLPGLNPGGMSRSEKLKVVHIYGWPEGMKP